MSNDRLPTEFWIQAQLRRFNAAGTGAYLLRRGDTERGTVLVRLIGKDGTRILIQVRDLDGKLAWLGVKEGAVLSNPDADAYVDAYADAPQESSRYQILQSRVNRKLKPQRSNTRRRPSGGSVISRADSTNSRSSASTSKTYRRYSRREKGKGADHDDDHEDGHGHGQEQRSRRFCDSGCLPSCLPTVGLGVGACLQSVVLCNQLGGYSYGGLGYGYGYGYGLGSYYGYGYGYPSSCTPALPVATVPYGTCLY